MPRAQNRAAKGSIFKEDEIHCQSGYIIYMALIMVCLESFHTKMSCNTVYHPSLRIETIVLYSYTVGNC